MFMDGLGHRGIIGTEVFKDDDGFPPAMVGDSDASLSSLFTNEIFIGAFLSEAQHDGSFSVIRAERTMPLNHNATVSNRVFNGDTLSGCNGDFLSSKERIAIDNPVFK